MSNAKIIPIILPIKNTTITSIVVRKTPSQFFICNTENSAGRVDNSHSENQFPIYLRIMGYKEQTGRKMGKRLF